ncbi:hypothetical protein VPH35_132452 [Triticum aestivum]
MLSTLWHSCSPAAGADPTVGFTAVEITEDRFKLHKPYNLPQEQRNKLCTDGVQRLWFDLPILVSNSGVEQITYSSGVWQFEGPPRNTTLMLHVYGGRLVYYNDETKVVDRHIYDWWFRLNLVHNIQASALTVFIDGDETLIVPGYGSDFHYFKFGVYTQTNPSHYMESRWRDLKVYTKTPY